MNVYKELNYTVFKLNERFKNIESFIKENKKFNFDDEFLKELKECLKSIFVYFKEDGCANYIGSKAFKKNIFLIDISYLLNEIEKVFYKEDIEGIYKAFENFEKSVYKGYLYAYLDELELIIDFQISDLFRSKELLIYEELEHFHLKYLLDFIKSLKSGKEFNFLSNEECNVGKILKNKDINLKNRDLIYKTHKNFHLLLELIYKLFREENYLKTYYTLKELESISYYLRILIDKEINNILKEENKRDPLTNLLNKRALNCIYKKLLDLSSVDNFKISFLMIDIDHFKKINDTYGHLAGDTILKEFAKALKNNLRKSDYIFRYGGEEFLVILPYTNKAQACKIANHIKEVLKDLSFYVEGKIIKTTVSIGVYEPSEKESLEDIIRKTDEKLYQAKKEGRDKAVC